jgi:hypothetical protein
MTFFVKQQKPVEKKHFMTNQNQEEKTLTQNKNSFSTSTISEKIIIEKRRRYQTYIALDYTMSAVTYFDFFSYDTFKMVKKAKYLAQICNKNVTGEFLLLPFFTYPSEVLTILNEFNVTQNMVENFLISTFEKKTQRFYETWLQQMTGFLGISEECSIDESIQYSHEVNILFEKAAENALTRFKTPVISPEILFVTMIEEKNTKVSKIIRKFLKTDTQWYLMRYKLLKHLHNQESNVRSEVVKNQHYFAYLMKTQLTNSEFTKLIENEALSKGVSFFRNTLVSKVLEMNVFEKVKEEIQNSIKINKKRSYSL